ncbi:MAG: hypothetical protein IT318_12830 [Anaerolineales bacterium]|nr:hypothetical protein [Anaerolineales bacterium]
MGQAAIHIVTGPGGTGKTTLCARIADGAAAVRLMVAGVISPAVFDQAEKVGIDVIALRARERRRLAALSNPAAGATHTRRWSFDAETLSWADAVLQAATPCDLLVVDELGPLEFERGEGWPAGLAAVDAGRYRWALVVVRRELLPAAARRWLASIPLAIAHIAQAGPLADAFVQQVLAP